MGGTRVKNHRQVSPERAKVWTEKSPKYRYNHNYNQQQQQQEHDGKVPVVYYLCRNRQLEHPHFMEVRLSSPEGLYLRDVIERLNVLRGRGMAPMYSWSCKRSYKNGFVWHDLCEDDLILPAHGTEYVLKGSELFEESNSGHFSPAETIMLQNQKALPEPPSSRSQEESSSSSSLNDRTTKTSNDDDELSPPDQRPCSSNVSPGFSGGKNSSWNGSLSLTEYKVYKNDGLADASTQTEDNVVRVRSTCTRGVSTDDGLVKKESRSAHLNHTPPVKGSRETPRDYVSPPPSASSATSSSGRTDTLESLIRADARKLNSFTILEEEEFRMPSNSKLKASTMLMQLISCGSISVKDHSFGLVPTYRPRFCSSEFSSPLFSRSLMMGELDCLSENPRLTGMEFEDREYFSGSLVETSMLKEVVPNLKRSSSFNADSRRKEKCDSVDENEDGNSTRTKCIPRSIKASVSKHPRCESMRSPLSDGPRISSHRVGSSRSMPCSSAGGSKRMSEPVSGKQYSSKPDSSRDDEEENVIKIEERLASGARVIITCDGEGKYS